MVRMIVKKEIKTQLPQDEFLIIAHRGASAYAPEHTLASYDLAASMGADYLEIDLNRTKDGKLIAFHDEVIAFNHHYKMVSSVTFEELQQYSPGLRFNKKYPHLASPEYESLRIPELSEVFAHFNGRENFYIELKSPVHYPGIEEQLLSLLDEYKLLDQQSTYPKVIIQSFHKQCLKEILLMAPSIPLVKLFKFKNNASLNKKEIADLKKYASGVGPNFQAITSQFVSQMHDNGLHVHPYTANKEKDIRALLSLDANGVFTDNPDIAIQVKKHYRQ